MIHCKFALDIAFVDNAAHVAHLQKILIVSCSHFLQLRSIRRETSDCVPPKRWNQAKAMLVETWQKNKKE
jgi:hypothetical protein